MELRTLLFLLLSAASFFLSAGAFATTYNYVGSNFTVGNVTAPYTTSMRVTGSITTSSPIPPNTTITLSNPLVTSWTFNDGVIILNNTNSSIDSGAPGFTTDASGAIINVGMAVRGQNPLPTALGGLTNIIYILHNFPVLGAGFDAGLQSVPCTGTAGGICYQYDEPVAASSGATADIFGGLNGQQGVWSIQAENVPSLSTWGIILLVLSLLFFSQKRMGFLLVKNPK